MTYRTLYFMLEESPEEDVVEKKGLKKPEKIQRQEVRRECEPAKSNRREALKNRKAKGMSVFLDFRVTIFE